MMTVVDAEKMARLEANKQKLLEIAASMESSGEFMDKVRALQIRAIVEDLP